MRRGERGFTLMELMTVVAFSGIMLGVAAINLRDINSSKITAANELAAFIKRARAKALSSTLAYTVRPQSGVTNKVRVTYGTSCSAAQTADSTLNLTLPGNAYLGNTSWSVCYGTRGLSDSSADISVREGSSSKTVRIVLGGGVKVL